MEKPKRKFKLAKVAEYICIYCKTKKGDFWETCPNCSAQDSDILIRDVRQPFQGDVRQHGAI